MGVCQLDSSGSCEYGNERFGCIQSWDYLEWLSNLPELHEAGWLITCLFGQ